jgi:hypothetical protein
VLFCHNEKVAESGMQNLSDLAKINRLLGNSGS